MTLLLNEVGGISVTVIFNSLFRWPTAGWWATATTKGQDSPLVNNTSRGPILLS